MKMLKVVENVKHVVAEGENAKISLERTTKNHKVVVTNQVSAVKICSKIYIHKNVYEYDI